MASGWRESVAVFSAKAAKRLAGCADISLDMGTSSFDSCDGARTFSVK